MLGAKLIGPGGLITDYSDLSLHFEVVSEPAFPASSVIEDFTGTNGTALASLPSGNWTNVFGSGGLTTQSNQCASTGTGSDRYNAATFGPDFDLTLDIVTPPAGADEEVDIVWMTSNIATWDANGQGYIIGFTTVDDALYLVRQDNGTGDQTVLDSTTQAISAGDAIGIRRIGNAIRLMYKPSGGSWSIVLSADDDTFVGAGGVAIFSSSDASTRLDNLTAGTLS